MPVPAPFPSLTKTWHADKYPAIDASRKELSLNGKVAVVTGAAGTIGFAAAKAFAIAGVKHVALTGRNPTTLQKRKKELEAGFPGSTVSIHIADIASLASTKTAMQEIRQQAGQPINVLVHSAAYLAEHGSIFNLDAEEFYTSSRTNIEGSFNVAKAFLAVSDPSATVVNLTSGNAFIPVGPLFTDMIAYSVGKAGGQKVFDFLQMEAPELRVVNVQPGVVASDMNSKASKIPPMDTADLPGHFCVWLCSSDADFLKGRTVFANWDVDEMKAMADKIKKSQSLVLTLEGFPWFEGERSMAFDKFA